MGKSAVARSPYIYIFVAKWIFVTKHFQINDFSRSKCVFSLSYEMADSLKFGM